MEFPQLEAFLEAANRGSFRRAADALYLSQPSVSARVRRRWRGRLELRYSTAPPGVFA